MAAQREGILMALWLSVLAPCVVMSVTSDTQPVTFDTQSVTSDTQSVTSDTPSLTSDTQSVTFDTQSVHVLCAASTSAARDDDTTASGALSAENRKYVTQFVRHVIDSLHWTSVTLFTEVTSDREEISDLLTDDNVAATVFQWSVSMVTDNTSHSPYPGNLHKALTSALSPHVLLLGSAAFVREILKEVLQVNEAVSVTFDWLIVVPRDQSSSLMTVAERFDNMAIVLQETLPPQITMKSTLREGDTTQLSTVTGWSPCKRSSPRSLTEDLVFPNKKYGLGGRTLRMATVVWDPFIIRHQNESSTWYTGLSMDLLNILATKLNFTYVISESADQNWGQRLSNGTWIGLVGMLHRKEADFSLTGSFLTPDRAIVLDYSRGFFFDELVLVTSFPDPTPVGWNFFSRPFHWLVYLLLGCGFLLMTVVLALIDRLSWHARNELPSEEKMEIKMPLILVSLAEAAEVLFGTLLGRPMDYTVTSTSGRVLLVAWLLLSLVTVATYTGKLTSNAVVIKQPVPFRSLGELVKRSDYTWGFIKGSMMDSFIGNSTNKDYQYFYRKMLEFEKTDPDVREVDPDISIRKLLTENFVRLTTETFYRFYKNQHCRLTMVRERLLQNTVVVYFQKGSPYKQMFDELIETTTDNGIIEYLTRKWFPEQSSCQEEKTRVMSVSLEQVPVAFLLAAGGLVLASGILLLEFLTRRGHRQR